MTWAQFNEDDIIDTLLGSPQEGVFVDIGAGDGMEISNSRLFRERGWWTILIEPNQRHHEALSKLNGNTTVYPFEALPDSINKLVPEETTILSIDVDGDDIFLLEALNLRPDVIVIEHNPTMPYHLDIQPAGLGLRIGSSVKALQRVAYDKGYGLVAVTHCNAIFFFGAPDIPIPDYKPPYYVATDYFTGRPLVLGEAPWGVRFDNPFPPADVIIR